MKQPDTQSSSLQHVSGDPLQHYAQWHSVCANHARLLVVDFELQQYWLPGAQSLALSAIYFINADGVVSVSVTESVLGDSQQEPEKQYCSWAREHGFARVQLGQALALQPTFITKPWGREIWYTGVEERGVCTIKSGGGESPLPWLQMVMPGEGIGPRGEPLILLKILDPVAEPVKGDLYFELHEKKREVYVVTHVDPQAWPGGTGYIRFGFSRDKLSQYCDAGDFKAAYLEAVSAYEQVRRAIDELQTSPREIAPELAAREQSLRQEMDSFTGMKPLKVGDVIKVPLLTPHSLQHGVRTIEFQTPVYERKILSFGQKVITQDHWDTREALAQAQLEVQHSEPLQLLSQDEGLLIERIVDFSDFEVQRLRLAPGHSLDDLEVEHYVLAIVVEGHLQLGEATFGPEQAVILPRGWQDSLASAQPAETLVLLLAYPRNSAVES